MDGPIVIIQARMGSTRMPGKVLADLGGRSVLSWVIRAAKESGVGEVVVATTVLDEDDAVVAESERLGVRNIRGSADDVLGRFVQVLGDSGDRPIVRLTADCPLLDPGLIRAAVAVFTSARADYASTTLERTLPRGLDVEVVSSSALRVADAAAGGFDRAHVTSYVYAHPERFRLVGLSLQPSAPHLRVTVDTAADLEVVRGVVDVVGDRCMSWVEVIETLMADPRLTATNAHVVQKDLEEG